MTRYCWLTPEEYMIDYASIIRAKYQELKEEEQLADTLQNWPEGERLDITTQMRAFVKELQSTRLHKITSARYHKDMQKVRNFFTMIFDDEKDRDMPKRMRSTFAASKEYFYQTDDEDRAEAQKVLKQFIKHVPVYYKERILWKIEQRIKDPDAFAEYIQQLIESKPHMELWAKIKEVAGRVVWEYDLWPIVWWCLLLWFLCNLWNIPPKDITEMFSIGLGTLASALRVETGIQWSISHTRKLHREQKEARAERNAKEALRR